MPTVTLNCTKSVEIRSDLPDLFGPALNIMSYSIVGIAKHRVLVGFDYTAIPNSRITSAVLKLYGRAWVGSALCGPTALTVQAIKRSWNGYYNLSYDYPTWNAYKTYVTLPIEYWQSSGASGSDDISSRPGCDTTGSLSTDEALRWYTITLAGIGTRDDLVAYDGFLIKQLNETANYWFSLPLGADGVQLAVTYSTVITPQYESMLGGDKVNGSGVVVSVFDRTPTSGSVRLNGTAKVGPMVENGFGGIRCGGTSDVTGSTTVAVSGGALFGGEAVAKATYRVDYVSVYGLPVIADTYIDKSAPSTTHGSSNLLMVYASSTQYIRRMLVKFDCTSIPEDLEIKSIVLALRLYQWALTRVEVYPVMVNWVENLATWTTYDGSTPWDGAWPMCVTSEGSSVGATDHFIPSYLLPAITTTYSTDYVHLHLATGNTSDLPEYGFLVKIERDSESLGQLGLVVYGRTTSTPPLLLVQAGLPNGGINLAGSANTTDSYVARAFVEIGGSADLSKNISPAASGGMRSSGAASQQHDFAMSGGVVSEGVTRNLLRCWAIAPPATRTLTTSRNLYLSELAPDFNFNDPSFTTLEIHKKQPSNVQHSLIDFDYSAIPDDMELRSTTLRIWAAITNDLGTGVANLRVDDVVENWNENSATWNVYDTGHAWDVPGVVDGTAATLLGFSYDAGWAWRSIPVNWVSDKTDLTARHGFVVSIHPNTSATEETVSTLRSGSQVPQLVVMTADPIGSMLVGGSALVTGDHAVWGGAQSAGVAEITRPYGVTVSGGAKLGGVALRTDTTNSIAVSGGAISGTQANYGIAYVSPASGGMVGGGFADIAVTVSMHGGLSLGALPVVDGTTNESGHGGARTAGEVILSKTNELGSGGGLFAAEATANVISVIATQASGGMVGSGLAGIGETVPMHGGLRLGTLFGIDSTTNEYTYGGAIAAGEAVPSKVHEWESVGGLFTAMAMSNVIDFIAMEGDILASGSTDVDEIINPDLAGGLCLGTMTDNTTVVEWLVGGGSEVFGVAFIERIFAPLSSGGAVCDPESIVKQIVNIVAAGGIALSGSARVESIYNSEVVGGALIEPICTNDIRVSIDSNARILVDGAGIPDLCITLSALGGIVCAGESAVLAGYVMVGGVVAAGQEIDNMICAESWRGGVSLSGEMYGQTGDISVIRSSPMIIRVVLGGETTSEVVPLPCRKNKDFICGLKRETHFCSPPLYFTERGSRVFHQKVKIYESSLASSALLSPIILCRLANTPVVTVEEQTKDTATRLQTPDLPEAVHISIQSLPTPVEKPEVKTGKVPNTPQMAKLKAAQQVRRKKQQSKLPRGPRR